MSDLFIKLVNMSISASWLVLAVLVLRFVLRKAPRWVNPILWGLVGIRLILPFSIESALSLIPSAETISTEIMYDRTPAIHSGISALNTVVNPIISASFAPNPAASANPLQIWIPVAAVVWIIGMVIMMIYAAVSYLRLNIRVKTAVLLRDNIYQSEKVESPFVLGFWHSRIYLPFHISDENMFHVIAHEQAHIKRYDHWIKPIGFLLLTLYWFNPVLWIAYILLCRDIELACDESVIREMDIDQRADYSQALLTCSITRKMVTACPLAFGEIGVKERVKNVLNYKKPAFWIIIVAVVSCIAAAACFLTNPKSYSDKQELSKGNIQWDTRPTLCMEGKEYVDPYMPVSQLPHGYELAGELSEEQANNTGLSGCEYYKNSNDADSFYVYQECGTPIDINTVDSEQIQWAYKRWIRVGGNAVEDRILTLDDVIMLAENGNDLTWEDFELYSYVETGSGLYIRVYEIDEMFSLWIGGGSTDEEPMYIYLKANDGGEETIDIRTGDVEEFIDLHKNNPVMIASYVFQESEENLKPSIALFDNGKFSFAFSLISSYFCCGDFEIKDDRLTLRTDDGKYVYMFDRADDAWVFDADASSEELWYSDIYDGAVFR